MHNDIYLAIVAKNAPAHTHIINIQAQDRDSEENGRIVYCLKEINEFPEFLSMNKKTGAIHNIRTFENAREGSIRANVTARDRPDDPTEFLSSVAQLIVNLLEDHHRIVLVLSTTSPDNAVEMKSQIIDFLQERSGLIIGIEKVDVRRLASANATTLDSRGSDITFYAVDPASYRLVTTDEPQVHSLFFSLEGKYSLLSAISNGLQIEASAIRHPYPSTWAAGVLYAAKTMEEAVDGFQAALLALSSIVAVLGVAAIVYLCFLWSRYETFRSKLQEMIGSPHLEPVLIEPSLKEYETQVLRMNINGDDFMGTIKGPPSPLMQELNASGYTEESSTDSLDQMQAYGSREELECDDVNALMVPALNPIYQSSDENSPQH
uniref:Cadherin domain-containing protein n=1 Tax=Strigamia maritima TaxID=126957 RepID=T1JF59_STRMM